MADHSPIVPYGTSYYYDLLYGRSLTDCTIWSIVLLWSALLQITHQSHHMIHRIIVICSMADHSPIVPYGTYYCDLLYGRPLTDRAIWYIALLWSASQITYQSYHMARRIVICSMEDHSPIVPYGTSYCDLLARSLTHRAIWYVVLWSASHITYQSCHMARFIVIY